MRQIRQVLALTLAVVLALGAMVLAQGSYPSKPVTIMMPYAAGGPGDTITRIIGNGMIDVHRTLDPDNDDLFTWWAPWRNMKQRNIGWRIDYVLASKVIGERARSCVVQRETGTSDHGPVVATFEL